MKDLAKIGLPLQIGGLVLALFLFRHLWGVWLGFAAHLVGDVFFFLAMRRRGCL